MKAWAFKLPTGKTLGGYQKNTQGSFAIMFAVSLLAILIAVGVAIDMYSMTSKKQTLQDAIDSAVVSSLFAEDEASARALLDNIFAQNSISGKVISYSIVKNDDMTEANATVEFDFPITFAGFLGVESKKITVSARAEGPNGPSSVKINIVSAKGDYNKVFKLMVDNGGGASEKIHAVYEKEPHKFEISNTGWIDLGKYEDVYFDFIVSTCGTSCDVHFRSDDPAEAHRLTVDGKRVPVGKAANIVQLVKCGGTAKHDWEDGGGGSPDFTYNIESKCNGKFVGPARLTG